MTGASAAQGVAADERRRSAFGLPMALAAERQYVEQTRRCGVKARPRIMTLGGFLLLASLARASGVEVATDAVVYDPGQSIIVTVSNSTDSTLVMYCDPPFWIESVATGEQAGPCGCVTWIVELAPGEVRTDTVPQVDCETGDPQPWSPGMYEVVLPYQLGTDSSSQGTATTLFCVDAGCVSTGAESEMESLSWGQVKARYSRDLSAEH
jgi:hypothetical protein